MASKQIHCNHGLFASRFLQVSELKPAPISVDKDNKIHPGKNQGRAKTRGVRRPTPSRSAPAAASLLTSPCLPFGLWSCVLLSVLCTSGWLAT